MKVLANDGISRSGEEALIEAGFEVIKTTVAQSQLMSYINTHNIDVLLVRSATKVREDIIDGCPSLKIIGRGGVGMDNIAVNHARKKGLHVINTPEASAQSVAELVFAHLFGGVRFLHDANRTMPLEGDTRFKELKKNYALGTELRGKTLGIIGFGSIGKEVAKIALGIGMKVIASKSAAHTGTAVVTLPFYNKQSIDISIEITSTEALLKQADFITIHVPAQEEYLIDQHQFEIMKNGVGIINAARGGVVNEVALIKALESGKVAFAGIDTFEEEPTPAIQVLMNGKISLTPHIGAATKEAQDRIGTELASQIIKLTSQN
ncbi:D-2-hydroxyacid dehydrogenase [Bizionia sediminis]|uniref:D-2-hydroxyacid dehydrogenase n=1 Tax=Bizionia sediminis TaxID=1737064 RepID=A0ABW5KSQ5_9FLAO